MPKLGQKVIVDESGANILPLLNLNGERRQPPQPGWARLGPAARRGEPQMKRALPVLGTLAGLVLLFASTYTIRETEQAIITQFGEPVGGAVTEPGLHFKLPFIHRVTRFDQRWLPWDGDANQITTRDKKFIWVDTYARWAHRRPAAVLPVGARRARRPEPPRRHH